jgi:hypothetical protein
VYLYLLYVFCFVIVYSLFCIVIFMYIICPFVLCVLVQGLLPPGENPIAVNNNNNNNIYISIYIYFFKQLNKTVCYLFIKL